MLQNDSCKVLCTVQLDETKKRLFRSMTEDEYSVTWLVDNLPGATRYKRKDASQGEAFWYMNGFPVGLLSNGAIYINNHVKLTLLFHSNPGAYEGYRIVGFEIEPH